MFKFSTSTEINLSHIRGLTDNLIALSIPEVKLNFKQRWQFINLCYNTFPLGPLVICIEIWCLQCTSLHCQDENWEKSCRWLPKEKNRSFGAVWTLEKWEYSLAASTDRHLTFYLAELHQTHFKISYCYTFYFYYTLYWHHIKIQFSHTETICVRFEFDECKIYPMFIFAANLWLWLLIVKRKKFLKWRIEQHFFYETCWWFIISSEIRKLIYETILWHRN